MTDEWSTSSNAAVTLRLISEGSGSIGGGDAGSTAALSEQLFHPEFTYPIYGEAETIYGYKGLKVEIAFASGSLKPILLVDWSAKNEKTQAKVDDPLERIRRFLPCGLPLPDDEGADGEGEGGADGDDAEDEDENEEDEQEQGEDDVLQASSRDELQALLAQEAQNDRAFRPMGTRVAAWTVPAASAKGKGKKAATGSGGASASSSSSPATAGDRHFEIYRCTKEDEDFLQYLRRFRIFTLFFIEAASYIDEEEPGWEFFLLFERRGGSAAAEGASDSATYHFAGFTSLYRFWTYPSSARIRLSQFLILPPYQQLGLGSALYTAVHDLAALRRGDAVAEITVEDPSEAFDRLRDGADLRRLLNPAGLRPAEADLFPAPLAFSDEAAPPPAETAVEGSVRFDTVAQAMRAGKLVAPLDAAWIEQTRRQYKIAPRQWGRLLEMILLLHLSSSTLDGGKLDAAQLKAYRLFVKARLWRHNRDVLVQLSKAERIRKLQETYENLLENEYADLIGVDVAPFLGGVDLPEGGEEEEEELAMPGTSAGAGSSGSGSAKRSNGHAAEGSGPPRKVARFA